MNNKILCIWMITQVMLISISYGQDLNPDQKRWSASAPLTVADFKIKTHSTGNNMCYAQFTIQHKIAAFDFLKKNLNQKIENVFLKSASWIDTTRVKDIDRQIAFQQLQFDLAEVSARKFRQRLLAQKGKIAKGYNFVTEISNQITTEFAEERLLLIQETDSGLIEEQVANWRKKVDKQLQELGVYAYENKKKIKLK